MKVPKRPQGIPSYDLSGGKYKPDISDMSGAAPPGTLLASRILPNNKVKNEYIPSLQKQMGINDNQYNLSLGCREVNDLKRVVRGNGVFYNRQLLNANPIRPLSHLAFSDDRFGFAANMSQSVQVAPNTYFDA